MARSMHPYWESYHYTSLLHIKALLTARLNFSDDDQVVAHRENDIYVAGKRQAKKYIRKALSFGVRSGYLIPADRQGNVLHVCPTLDTGSWSTRRADVESRRRRRIARRGETRPTTIDDRKAMRRGIPRDKSRHDVDQEQRTSRKHFAQNPARSLSVRESNRRKSPDESTLRERNKPKTVTKRKRLVNFSITKEMVILFHVIFIISFHQNNSHRPSR